MLQMKEAKLARLDEQEGDCMSRLAAIDMVHRRLTLANSCSRPNRSADDVHQEMVGRARALSGAYGLTALGKNNGIYLRTFLTKKRHTQQSMDNEFVFAEHD